MTTMTVQIPTGQVNWFEQMLRSMGWAFRKEETSASASEKPRVFEAEVDEPDILVTGDKDLTDLHQFGHCQILTLAAFKRMYL